MTASRRPRSETDQALDQLAIRSLRIAATLAAVIRGLRVRLSGRTGVILEVREAPDDTVDHAIVPACWLRRQVAEMHGRSVDGERLAMCGLADPGELVVELGHPNGTAALAGGIHRVEVPAGTMYLFATTLGLEHAQAAAAGDDIDVTVGSAEHLEVGFLHDDATAITLAQILAPAGADGGPYLEVIQHVLVRCAAGEWFGVADGGAS